MKLYYIIILIILMIGLVSACSSNNELYSSDDKIICLGQGVFENSTGGFEYFDNSVTCKISIFYINNTPIFQDKSMTLTSNIMQYNISSYSLPVGSYKAFSWCYRTKGKWGEWFDFSILQSPVPTIPSSSGGGGQSGWWVYPDITGTGIVNGTYEESNKTVEDEIQVCNLGCKFNSFVDAIGKHIWPGSPRGGFVIAIIVILFGAFIYDKKKSKIKGEDKDNELNRRI